MAVRSGATMAALLMGCSSRLLLKPAIGAVVTQRPLSLPELFVQPRGVVMRVGEIGRKLEAPLVAFQRFGVAVLVFERDRAVEIQQRLDRTIRERKIIQGHRVVAA